MFPSVVLGKCTCDEDGGDRDKKKALRYKIAAIISILVGGGIGVLIPILGKTIPALRPEKNIFFIIKAFAAGVILATGFIHVLPDAFDSLTSPCLNEHPWGDFPFTGFVAMVAAIGTLMVDASATSYYSRSHFRKSRPAVCGDEEKAGEHEGHVHVHTHATHGHSHGSVPSSSDDELGSAELIRHRVISQVFMHFDLGDQNPQMGFLFLE